MSNVTIVIGGDGTNLGRLKTLAKELGVLDSVRFPGTINRADVPAYFHLCDIFTLPAVFDPKGNVDGCPNVILEAMACGKPVVASGISGIPVVVKDRETGILVEEKNVKQLAEALIALLTDKAKREHFGKELHHYGDLHRYLPILAHQAGYNVAEVKVKHHPRRFGVSKYGFKRIPKGFFDLLTVLFLTNYLKRPLHVFGTLGSLVAFIGVLIGLYLAVLWVVEGCIGFRPLLMLSILMVILGLQFFSIGLLASSPDWSGACFRRKIPNTNRNER